MINNLIIDNIARVAKKYQWRNIGLFFAGLFFAVAAQANTQSNIAISGKVVAPSNSPTLGSQSILTPGDQVQWTGYVQSKLSSPFVLDGQISLPAQHGYISKSFKGPDKVTGLQWKVNGNWTSVEPATGSPVTDVKWTYSNRLSFPKMEELSAAFSFDGEGDGYRIISYQNRLYVLNHHKWNNYFHCRVASTGALCPGWPLKGKSISLEKNELGVADGSGAFDNLRTTPNPVEAINRETGEVFWGIPHNNGHAYMVCINLKTESICGSWDLGKSSIDMAALGGVNGKYYNIRQPDGMLSCFDFIKKQTCGEYSYELTTLAADRHSQSLFIGSRLYIHTGDNRRIFCHDTALNTYCQGWGYSGVKINGLGLYPYLNTQGEPIGMCTQSACIDLSGYPLQDSGVSAYINFVTTYEGYTTPEWMHREVPTNMYKTRVYGTTHKSASLEEVGCFDFSTQSSCGSWRPGFQIQTYGTSIDPARKKCIMMTGHLGNAYLFDEETKGPCQAEFPNYIEEQIFDSTQYFLCDPQRNNITAWRQLRISPNLLWGASGLRKVSATIKDVNGQYINNKISRNFAYSSYTIDISDIDPKKYPILKVSIDFEFNKSVAVDTVLGMDVTWDGDPMQFCVNSQAPKTEACAASVSSKFTANTKESHYLTSGYQESLNASVTMAVSGDDNVPDFGYAAISGATTLKLNLSDLGPQDPKTRIVQGRWDLTKFSGDLWLFNLDKMGQIDTSSYVSAVSVTPTANSRQVFTADVLNGKTSAVKNFLWPSLNASQKSALNTGVNGSTDNRGEERLNYLRGIDGSFRARSGNVLGPVINSAPAVLPTLPQAGWQESSFPGYQAYRSQKSTRANPIAFYGGNDGALHAYEILSNGMKEAYAFIPEIMLGQASRYAESTLLEIQNKPYFVDNIPLLGHARVNGALGWRAVAVMLYGRGARAITALDVSHPNLSAGAGVLFDYNNTTDPALKDLGYIISQPNVPNLMHSPQIIQIGPNRRSAVLVGNGINSQDGVGGTDSSGPGKPVLYAFYLDQSVSPRWHRWAADELWKGSDPSVGTLNGLSTPRPVDTDGDGIVDVAYAGDMKGNLWRFDIRTPDSVQVTRLFKTAGADKQPISQAPYAQINPQASGCAGVTAGTSGRCWQVIFHTGDPISPLVNTTNTTSQSIYSVLDKGKGAELTASDLIAVKFAVDSVTYQGIAYRALAANTVNYAGGKLGWYLNYADTEHGVGAPRLLPSGALAFSSIQTSSASSTGTCSAQSLRSWLNEVDPLHGTLRTYSFDLNQDNKFDSSDLISLPDGTSTPPNGMAISGAQYGPPIVFDTSSVAPNTSSLLLPGLGQDNGSANAWSGGGSTVSTTPTTQNKNSRALRHANRRVLGRMTWREVR